MSELVVAAMATMPQRLDRLEQAVQSLRTQVDVLRVYLNGFVERPTFLSKEEGVLSNDAEGDLGDAGKMYWLDKADYGYYLTVDDDLLYPYDFAERQVVEYDQRNGKAITAVHGFVFSQPIEHYATSRQEVYRYTAGLNEARPVHIAATCTTNFGPNPFGLSLKDFPRRNMTDLQLGILAQRQQIPLVVIPRVDSWIHDLEPSLPENNFSIWSETKKELGYDLARIAREGVAEWKILSDPLEQAT